MPVLHPSLPSRQLGRIFGGILLVIVILAVAFSNEFGRAEPTGRYRPELPPPTLTLACYPLPGDATLDFGAVVRTDGDVTLDGVPRRQMVLHYLDLDVAGVRAALVEAFTEAGYVETGASAGAGSATTVTMTGPNGAYLVFDIEAFDVPEETVVKGEVTLDLPVQELASDDPWCSNWYATKRFPTEG